MPGCAPGGAPSFLASPRKEGKRRRPHCLRPQRCALGATCGARVQRGLAQTRCAQTVAIPNPLAAALLGAYRGVGQPTSIRAIASLGPTSRAQAPRAGRSAVRVERSDDPCGCWDVRLFGYPPPVAAPAAGRLRGGTRVEARVLRELTRRGCPNGALQRAVSFAAHPATAPTQVCPFAPRRGRRLGIAFLLGTFLWRSKEKYLACRGDNPAPALGTGMRPNQPTSPSFDRLSPNGLGNCMRELSIK